MSDKFSDKASLTKTKKIKKTKVKDKSNSNKNTTLAPDIKAHSSRSLKSESVADNKKELEDKSPNSKILTREANRLEELKAKLKASRSAIYKASKQRLKDNPKFKEKLENHKAAQKTKRKEILQKIKMKQKLEKLEAKSPRQYGRRDLNQTKIDRLNLVDFFEGIKSECLADKNPRKNVELTDKPFKKERHHDRYHEEQWLSDKNSETGISKHDKTKLKIQTLGAGHEGKNVNSKESHKLKSNGPNSKSIDKTKPRKELLLRTGSNPELRTLADIIAVDFINKKRKKSEN